MARRAEIERVLDRDVRPNLAEHGGEIRVLDLDEDGTLHIELLGSCSNCPGATLTTETLVEEALVNALSYVSRVVLVQSVSDELLDFARALIRDSAAGGKAE